MINDGDDQDVAGGLEARSNIFDETIALSQALEDVVIAGQEPVAMLVRPATGTATDVKHAALSNGGGF